MIHKKGDQAVGRPHIDRRPALTAQLAGIVQHIDDRVDIIFVEQARIPE
jgi:hypothetical protein